MSNEQWYTSGNPQKHQFPCDTGYSNIPQHQQLHYSDQLNHNSGSYDQNSLNTPQHNDNSYPVNNDLNLTNYQNYTNYDTRYNIPAEQHLDYQNINFQQGSYYFNEQGSSGYNERENNLFSLDNLHNKVSTSDEKHSNNEFLSSNMINDPDKNLLNEQLNEYNNTLVQQNNFNMNTACKEEDGQVMSEHFDTFNTIHKLDKNFLTKTSIDEELTNLELSISNKPVIHLRHQTLRNSTPCATLLHDNDLILPPNFLKIATPMPLSSLNLDSTNSAQLENVLNSINDLNVGDPDISRSRSLNIDATNSAQIENITRDVKDFKVMDHGTGPTSIKDTVNKDVAINSLIEQPVINTARSQFDANLKAPYSPTINSNNILPTAESAILANVQNACNQKDNYTLKNVHSSSVEMLSSTMSSLNNVSNFGGSILTGTNAAISSYNDSFLNEYNPHHNIAAGQDAGGAFKPINKLTTSRIIPNQEPLISLGNKNIVIIQSSVNQAGDNPDKIFSEEILTNSTIKDENIMHKNIPSNLNQNFEASNEIVIAHNTVNSSSNNFPTSNFEKSVHHIQNQTESNEAILLDQNLSNNVPIMKQAYYDNDSDIINNLIPYISDQNVNGDSKNMVKHPQQQSDDQMSISNDFDSNSKNDVTQQFDNRDTNDFKSNRNNQMTGNFKQSENQLNNKAASNEVAHDKFDQYYGKKNQQTERSHRAKNNRSETDSSNEHSGYKKTDDYRDDKRTKDKTDNDRSKKDSNKSYRTEDDKSMRRRDVDYNKEDRDRRHKGDDYKKTHRDMDYVSRGKKKKVPTATLR